MDSSGDVVIRVGGLGKKSTLQHQQKERHNTLRDSLSHQAAVLGRWVNPFTLSGQIRKARQLADRERAEREEEFWALKDVSFEIRRGERVGIIGRNGAGKSTLLKILSRITEPTTGRVEIHGRVASLLEVGTGFHPELTGRENIYLNGAILGMTRREIRLKFDEIVEFAEVDKFLDTPVKRYSSGMYVRLAFAVAAHLEPDILVVDEVLAVGDAGFQQKCIGKMSKVTKEELKTLLFVSHQLHSLSSICERAIWLKNGIVSFDAKSDDSIKAYMVDIIASDQTADLMSIKDREGCEQFRFKRLMAYSLSEQGPQKKLASGLPCKLEIHFESKKIFRNVDFGVAVQTLDNKDLMTFSTKYYGSPFLVEEGQGMVTCTLDCLPVRDGKYGIRLYAGTEHEVLDWIKSGIFIEIETGDLFASRSLGTMLPETVIIPHKWSSV